MASNREQQGENHELPVPSAFRSDAEVPEDGDDLIPGVANVIAIFPYSTNQMPEYSAVVHHTGYNMKVTATSGPAYDSINFVDYFPPGYADAIGEEHAAMVGCGLAPPYHAEKPSPSPEEQVSDLIARMVEERVASQDPNLIARHFQPFDNPASTSQETATTSAVSTNPEGGDGQTTGETATECVGFQPCIDIVKGLNASLDQFLSPDGVVTSINREIANMRAVIEERRQDCAEYEKQMAEIDARNAELERQIEEFKKKDLAKSSDKLANQKAVNLRLEELLKTEESKAKESKTKEHKVEEKESDEQESKKKFKGKGKSKGKGKKK